MRGVTTAGGLVTDSAAGCADECRPPAACAPSEVRKVEALKQCGRLVGGDKLMMHCGQHHPQAVFSVAARRRHRRRRQRLLRAPYSSIVRRMISGTMGSKNAGPPRNGEPQRIRLLWLRR